MITSRGRSTWKRGCKVRKRGPSDRKLKELEDVGERLKNSSRRKRKIKVQKHKGSKSEYEEYINSDAWDEKRKLAFSVYGRVCLMCGFRHGTLHVHHKTYKRFKNELIEDLCILCHDCHIEIHKKGKGKGKRKGKKNNAWRMIGQSPNWIPMPKKRNMKSFLASNWTP